MEDDDATVVRSSHSHGPELPPDPHGDEQGANWLPAGTVLGEFEIQGLVGEGGFSNVYRAYDRSLDRMVAIKEFMPAGMASRTQTMHVTVRSRRHVDTFKLGLRSFVNEARLLARFDSPSLVKVYRFWEANGTAYMVMPLYEGMTVRQALKGRHVIPDERWLRGMLASLLDAMDTIHREQCYHRDIAPDNIIILRDGRPLLLDFGAARRVIGDATQSLTVILKPGFAPIEQYAETAGMRQGSWTDIYAVAAVAYFVVSGKPPPPSVARMVRDEMEPAREVGRGRYSEQLLAVLDQALAVLPANRLQTVADFRDALGLQEGVPRTVPGAALAPTMAIDDAFGDRWATDVPRMTGPRSDFQMRPAPEQVAGHGDERVLPPEQRRSGKGLVIAGVAVAACVAAAAVGYRWWSPAERVAARGNDVQETKPSTEVAAPASVPPEPPPAVLAETKPAEAEKNVATPPPAAETTAPPIVAAAPATAPAPAIPEPPSRPATPPVSPPVVAKAAPVPSASREEELWRAATASRGPSGYEAYLKQFPNGRYAIPARAVLEANGTKPRAKQDQQQAQAAAPGMSQQQRPNGTAVAKADVNVDRNAQSPGEGQKGPGAASPSASPPAASGAGAGAGTEAMGNAGGKPTGPSAAPASGSSSSESAGTQSAKADSKPEPAPAPQAKGGAGTTIKAPDRTMTGAFTTDPATGITSGTGLVEWNNGDRFEGRVVKGSKEGKGRFTWANGQSYDGDWVNDAPNGRGTMVFANGNRYEGEVRNGQPNGKGVLQFANGHRYEGEVKAGLPNGTGTIKFKSGDSYTGGWLNGKHDGHGRYTWANGTYWEGEYKDNQKTENGKTVFNDGKVVTGAVPSTSPHDSASSFENAGSGKQSLETSAR